MSTEDRVRAATRARADLVRDIRPLEFPPALPAPGRHARRNRRGIRWLSWGAPLAAAALVTALALVLVMLRQAGGPQAASPAAGASAAASSAPATAASAAIPRYYVALNYMTSGNSPMQAVVGDDQAGRTIAVLSPADGQNYYGVTGAADDRTFVVMNYTDATQQTTWYRLRIAPGTAHPAQLTKLPMKPLVAHVGGLALSPDGRELAVMWRTATTQTNAVTYLAVYSMASGAVLHTWITRGDNVNAIVGGANGEALAWVNGDQGISFNWTVLNPGTPPSATRTVRRIDVTAPGGDLLASSRVAVRLPPVAAPTKTTFSNPCAQSVTAADGTVVCGTSSFTDVSFEEVCSTIPPAFVTYSGTTGKRLKVLYQWPGQCLEATAMPVWTDSAGSHVIAWLSLSLKGVKTSASRKFGLVTDGHFTALPKLVVGAGPDLDQGGLAF